MNVASLLELMRVVCESAISNKYSDATRKRLLEGIYDLADLCQETMDAPDSGVRDRLLSFELESMKEFAEIGLRDGHLRQALLHIFDCLFRAIPDPSESD